MGFSKTDCKYYGIVVGMHKFKKGLGPQDIGPRPIIGCEKHELQNNMDDWCHNCKDYEPKHILEK